MFESILHRRDERPLRSVPLWAWSVFTCTLLAQIAWSVATPRGRPTAADLGSPPSHQAVSALSLGDPLAAAKVMNLLLQAHDNQPGISIPFAQLDYPRLIQWLHRILELDPEGAYPLLAASRLYAEVNDPQRQRLMLEFVHLAFHQDPNRRWPALAHSAYIARHRLKDLELARSFAASLRREATGPGVPAWVRQMEVLLLADIREVEAARVLLGAMLESGQITDPAEMRFLTQRLSEIDPELVAPGRSGR